MGKKKQMIFWTISTVGKFCYTSPFSPLIRPFSIAVVAPFVGLRRFPQGRNFKQWTGDDSKALMKVRTIIYEFFSLNHSFCRSTFQQSKVMSLRMLYERFMPSWTFVTLLGAIHTTQRLLKTWTMHSSAFINIGPYL